jgi:hypothetical protein
VRAVDAMQTWTSITTSATLHSCSDVEKQMVLSCDTCQAAAGLQLLMLSTARGAVSLELLTQDTNGDHYPLITGT